MYKVQDSDMALFTILLTQLLNANKKYHTAGGTVPKSNQKL
jgi:hypothetical protein